MGAAPSLAAQGGGQSSTLARALDATARFVYELFEEPPGGLGVRVALGKVVVAVRLCVGPGRELGFFTSIDGAEGEQVTVLPIPPAALPSTLNDAVQGFRLLPLPTLRELELEKCPLMTTLCTVSNQDGKASCAIVLVMVSKKLLLKKCKEEAAQAAVSGGALGTGAARAAAPAAAGAGGAVIVGKGLGPMAQMVEDARRVGVAHIDGAPVVADVAGAGRKLDYSEMFGRGGGGGVRVCNIAQQPPSPPLPPPPPPLEIKLN